MKSTFTIRRCHDVEEACHYFLKWPCAEGWNHSPDDEEIRQVFYPCDPNGFLVGTIINENEEETVIATMLAMRHTEKLAFIGCFIVANDYRGKGYGSKLFQFGMDYLTGCQHIGLFSMPNVVSRYESIGFDSTAGWIGKTYRGDITKNVLEKLTQSDYQDVNIIDWSTAVQRENSHLPSLVYQLSALDKRYNGMDRINFWKTWVNLHSNAKAANRGRHAVVVTDTEGKLEHFASIRPAEVGFVIAIYSSNLRVVKALLRHLSQWVVNASASWSLPKNQRLLVSGHACGSNPTSFALYEELSFETVSGRVQMWRGESPKADFSGLYGVASLTVG